MAGVIRKNKAGDEVLAKGSDNSGDDHIINQLRKAQNLGNHEITFGDKKKHSVDNATAHKALRHYESLNSAADKLAVAARMQASHQGLQDVISGKKVEVAKERPQPSMPGGFKPKGLPQDTGASRGVAPAGGRKAKRLSNVADPKSKYRPD